MKMKRFQHRIHVIATCLLLAACGPAGSAQPASTPTLPPLPTITSTPPPTSTPTVSPTPIVYDGEWFGTTSAGGRISFIVLENALSEFKISFSFATDQGSCDVTSDTQISPSLGIAGDEFSIALPSITFTGTFDSATTAAGHVTASEDSPRCVGGIDVDWTAFRQ